MRIVVIGAGVLGLSSAIRLLQAGYQHVTVIAKHKTPHTTSDGAGALWRPQIEHLDQQTATFGKWGLEVAQAAEASRRQLQVGSLIRALTPAVSAAAVSH